MITIHVVHGQCGHYSDYSEWPVRAFYDPALADALAGRLNDWCKAHGVAGDNDFVYFDLTEKPEEDPNFGSDYTGTQYVVRTIELDETPVALTEKPNG